MTMASNPTAPAETTPNPQDAVCEPLVAGQVARSAIATVEEIHQTFLKSLQNELAELLQDAVTTSFQGTKQAPVSTPMRGIPSGDRAIQLDLSPLPASAYLVFPPALLFRVLDILLATPSATTPEDDPEKPRTVTGIELFILKEFFEVFAETLRDAWGRVYPAAFEQTDASYSEEGPRIPDSSELALVLRSGIDLPGLAADFVLVLPTFLARTAQLKSTGTAANEGILKTLGAASLHLDAVLQGPTIRIRDLLAVSPGQILMIGNSEDSTFDCLVNGRKQFSGTLIPSGEHCALRIETLANQMESSVDERTVN